MAATTFKQQCPSCEALVPIRDPKLIGRKIDCPKCKYRFVVEEPADEAEDAEEEGGKKNGRTQQAVTARRPVNARGAVAGTAGAGRRDADEDDEDDRPAAKKKGGGSTVLILGIGLGAVALVLLAVVLIVIFSKSDTPTKPSGNPSAGSGSGSGSGNNEKEPEPPATVQLADATNYLPNDAEIVKSVRVDKLIDSTVGQAAFQTPGAFSQEAFQRKFGFPLGNVTQIVHASNETNNWVFNVVRLDSAKPVIKEEDLAANLSLKKSENKPQGLEYYLIEGDLDSFSFLFLSNRTPRQLALHILDPHTLVVASEAPMVQFLTDKRQPNYISQPPTKIEQDEDPDNAPKGPGSGPTSPAPSGPGGPTGPGGSGGPGGPGGRMPYGPSGPGGSGGPPTSPSPGGRGPGGGFSPIQPSAGSGGPGGPTGPGGFPNGPGAGSAPPAQSASGSFLTVSKELKSMMDKLALPEDPKQPTLVCMAMNTKAGGPLLIDNLSIPGVDVSQFLVKRARDLQIIGVCLKAFNRDKLTCVIGIDCKSDSVAHRLDVDARELLPALSKAIEEKLDLQVQFPGQTPGTGTGAQPNRPPFGPPGGGYGPQSPPPPGGGGYGPQSPPPPGSGGYGPRSGSGGYGPQSPAPGKGGMVMPEGIPGGGRFPGFPGAGGGPNAEDKPEDTTSSMQVSRSENTVLLSVSLTWKKDIPDLVYAVLQEKIARAKGLADMGGGRSRIHDLAEAVRAYSQEKKQFPRGTADRRSGTDRAGLPYRPDLRVSWLAELLPYLGEGEYKDLRRFVDDQKSWRDTAKKNDDSNNNAFAAQTLVPYFLAAKSPETSWWFSYPGLDQPVASTHYVGIAGIGMDAADYSAKDTSVAKKLGVFGYDRVTKLDDIKDGLENTIVMLQVPNEVKSAWLAGGGSTVRGVPETDPILPFVCTEYNKKLGTFAIMADGRVRFISKDINPDTFKAMCTINGGETIENLDEVAPVVPGGSKPVLKPQLPPEVKPPEAKPPVDGAKPPDGVKAPPGVDGKPSAPVKPTDPPGKP